MIPWETIRPALVSLVCDLADLQVDWLEKQRSYTDPRQQARVFLLVQSEEAIGIDDRRYADLQTVIPEANLEASQNGHRRVNLDVRVESFRHDDDRFAFNAISRIRSGLGFQSSLDRLRELNIAIIRKSAAINVPNVANDQRITSVAVLDLELAIGICFADTKNRLSSIDTVNAPIGTYSNC